MIGNTDSKNTGAKDTLISIGSHVNTQAGHSLLFCGFFVYTLFWYGSQNATELSFTLPMAHVCSNVGRGVSRDLLSDSVCFVGRINIKAIEDI